MMTKYNFFGINPSYMLFTLNDALATCIPPELTSLTQSDPLNLIRWLCVKDAERGFLLSQPSS